VGVRGVLAPVALTILLGCASASGSGAATRWEGRTPGVMRVEIGSRTPERIREGFLFESPRDASDGRITFRNAQKIAHEYRTGAWFVVREKWAVDTLGVLNQEGDRLEFCAESEDFNTYSGPDGALVVGRPFDRCATLVRSPLAK